MTHLRMVGFAFSLTDRHDPVGTGRAIQRLALVALLLIPTPLIAQSGEQVQDTIKHGQVAFTVELFVPLFGHAYAGDVRQGVLPAAVFLSGGGTIVVGAVLLDAATQYGAGLMLGLAGFGVAVVGKAWGLASAVHTAREYNRRLQGRVSPTLGFTPDKRASIGVSLRF